MTWHKRFLSFDTETTGFGPHARIIEAGIVIFEGTEIVETWSSLFLPSDVNWEDDKVKKALEVNHIERSALEGQPRFEDVFHEIYMRFTECDTWVAHNTEFDEKMLAQEFARVAVKDFPLESCLRLDTMSLSHRIHPLAESHKLGDTAVRWGVIQDGAHRAASDAITCGRILLAMNEQGHLPNDPLEMHSIQKQAAVGWRTKPRTRRW